MLYLNGESCPLSLAREGRLGAFLKERGHTGFVLECTSFTEEFYDPRPDVEVLTSGSTGEPKTLQALKARMLASAAMTVSFLKLKNGDSALLCMPLKHIAGKMVVVRALYQGLRLTAQAPSANPFATAPFNLDFAALTPMQAYGALQEERSRACLASCKNIIVGGGFLDPELENALSKLPHAIYHSYGMTETLSHIALRRVGDLGPEGEALFYPLPGVTVFLSERGTLVIHAPALHPTPLETHDLAKLRDGGFCILGRSDNIINSGAIKLIPEQIEKKLSALLPGSFAITARKSLKFGEEAILVTAQPHAPELLEKAFALLDPYEKPHDVIVHPLPLTPTGKISRAKLKELFYRR